MLPQFAQAPTRPIGLVVVVWMAEVGPSMSFCAPFLRMRMSEVPPRYQPLDALRIARERASPDQSP
jgi:hypothetical protein